MARLCYVFVDCVQTAEREFCEIRVSGDVKLRAALVPLPTQRTLRRPSTICFIEIAPTGARTSL